MAELVDARDSKSRGAIHGSSILPPGTRNMKPKILVIVGPTASGKSDLAVELALKYNGEVISADSRQVYRGLDLGTGKIREEEMKGVPHHLLDVADPSDRFTAMDWKVKAEKAVEDILSRGKLPIICGGTGFYIQALVDDLGFPEVPAETEEQKLLEEKSPEELFELLRKLDPERAKTIDMKNKRRLSRAIVIARKLGSVPTIEKPHEPKYDALEIGITLSNTQLKDRIMKRLLSRLDMGMIDEVRSLHENGLSYERMDELGLEYRYISEHLRGTLSREVMLETLYTKIGQYAKRQKTWFKRDQRIKWFDQPVDMVKIEDQVKAFLHGITN